MAYLDFEPLIPPAVWITLTAVWVALLAWYGWGRPVEMSRRWWGGIIALMAACGALVLGILLNPTWIETVPPPEGKPLLTVLVDGSASMGTADADKGRSRYQEAAKLAGQLADDLTDRFDVRVWRFDESTRASSPRDLAGGSPDGIATDLAAAVSAAVGEDRPQGQAVVLLSDGIDTRSADAQPILAAAQLARAMNAPLYCKPLGGPAEVRDIAVELRAARELAFINQRVPVKAVVRHTGFRGAAVTLSLLDGDKVIERQQVTLADNDPQTARFHVARDTAGLHRFQVRLDPQSGEATPLNNQATFLLRTVDRPIRILVVEGKPYWDSKFLARTLAADALTELDCVVRVAGDRLIRQKFAVSSPTATMPSDESVPAEPRTREWTVLTDPGAVLASREQLKEYQIILLGRDVEPFLTETALAALREWLAHDAGSLLCYRGSPVTQVNENLARLMPVVWSEGRESRFHPRLTEPGRELGWLSLGMEEEIAALPTLATGQNVGRLKPLATVLASAGAAGVETDQPVVSYQPYGTGRVVVIEGAGMWRWAFLPPEQQGPEGVYGSLWHGLLRWLAALAPLLPGEDIALRPDKVTFDSGEIAGVLMRLRDAAQVPPAIELVSEGQTISTFTPMPLKDEPGAFRAVFGKLPEGRYTVRIAGEKAEVTSAFDVVRSPREEVNLKARPELLARMAAESGGDVLDEASADEVTRRFREHLAASQPLRTRRNSAWDRWWIMLAVLATWATAWGLRRRGGLI